MTESTVNVSSEQVVPIDCSPTTNALTADGSCPMATYGAGDYLPHKLTFESNGGNFSYEFTVSGELGKSTAMEASINDNDVISGSTATGQGGGGGADSYGFSGDVVAFDVSGDVTVYLDGTQVNPGRFPKNTLTIDGNGGSSYEFAVNGDLKKSTAMGGSIQSNDTVSGSSASGRVGYGRDSYSFTGGIRRFKTSADPTVYLNGSEIVTDQYPDNGLTIESNGGRFSYHFTVAEGLHKTNAMGASIDDNDTIRRNSAIGQGGGGGADSYVYSGDLAAISVDGDATVYHNGEVFDSGRYPNSALTIDGTGSGTRYKLAVAGDLEQSTADEASINPGDTLSGSTASGRVGGGRDSYVFSGRIDRLRTIGDAPVYLNGEQVSPVRYPNSIVTFDGSGSTVVDYEFSVTTSKLRKTPVYDSSINSGDTVSGSTASGAVSGGRDSYAYMGRIARLSLDGPVRFDLDRSDRTITIRGSGDYSFRVSGSVDPITNPNPKDDVGSNGADGRVAGGRDKYSYTGTLESLTIPGVSTTVK